MMEASFTIGRIRGIPIGIHYTWLFVFALLSYSLAVGLFPAWYPGWTTGQYWIIGILASLLLFASVLAHELGHSLVAIAKGIPVRSITLFIFGGVAALSEESEEPGDEFLIAIAGPAVSVAIAAVSYVLYLPAQAISEQVAAILLYLFVANAILVVFNMIPGYPLDGGRVLRSIIWGVTNNVQRATRIASTVGVIIGYLFIVVGIFTVFTGNIISGIWFAAIGWFLQNAAEQSYQQLRLRRTFEGVRVRALMDPRPLTVPPDVTIGQLVDRYVLARNVRGLPVIQDNHLIGIITLTDIKGTPREQWDICTVRERMTPRDKLIIVEPDSDLEEVLRVMSERDIHQIPVMQNGALVGLLTRSAVIRFLQLRQELDVPTALREASKDQPSRAGSADEPI